ncbi:hypothetical protein [Ferrimonas lipolytica]|uniref:Uncharacterized protein n=1 Tax=Ferrimonas lipolytica TaxID=2724191 RepID=A0A6H1UFL9_9GAMM|nr:hypothetical protein [Ferrimonas lipolytica]QIZ76592.1 hypothetical protein HER31_06765 [Ferrimonas lipolytica]
MFKIDVLSHTLKTAFATARHSIQPMLGAAALVLAILFAVALVGFQLIVEFNGIDPSSEEAIAEASLPLQLVILIIAAPFEAGLAYMAWLKVNNLPVTMKQLFQPWAMATPLIAIAILSSVAGNVGLAAFVIPGLYLIAVLSFANIYYLFRRGSPLKAMWESAQVVHKNLFLIVMFHMAMGTVIMLSAIPFGLGLVFTVPMYFYGKALLFNELFPQFIPNQQQPAPTETTDSPSESSSFEA